MALNSAEHIRITLDHGFGDGLHVLVIATCLIGMEACVGVRIISVESPRWSRRVADASQIRANDFRDAEAVQRPTMKLVVGPIA
jgi:hypothetical protein